MNNQEEEKSKIIKIKRNLTGDLNLSREKFKNLFK